MSYILFPQNISMAGAMQLRRTAWFPTPFAPISISALWMLLRTMRASTYGTLSPLEALSCWRFSTLFVRVPEVRRTR